jgi:hypothetical protein
MSFDEGSLIGYADAAIEELKRGEEWDAEEDAVSRFADYEPKTGTGGTRVRAVILIILRGETPEGIYVYFEPKPTKTRANVEEVKKQIRAYFQDKRGRYEWPVAFTIGEVRRNFPRTYEDWSPGEELCYAVLRAKGKERAELAQIFQRAPGAALSPPHEVEPESVLAEDSAVKLLGAEVRCNNCHHSAELNYALLAHAAKKSGIDVQYFSTTTLIGALKQFKCLKCGLRSARIGG